MFRRNSSQVSARDKYLSALAEMKAAEAEFIASEQRRKEEELLAEELALRRRLEEIQLHKKSRVRYDSALDDDSYDLSSYRHRSYGRHTDTPKTEDRLTRLRRELEEEELRVARQKKQEREMEAVLRREKREAEKIALRRKEEENRLALIRRQREQEEKRLLELRRAAAVNASATCKVCINSARSSPNVHDKCLQKTSQSCLRPSTQPSRVSIDWEASLGQAVKSKDADFTSKFVSPEQPSTNTPLESTTFEDFLRLVSGAIGPQSKKDGRTPATTVNKAPNTSTKTDTNAVHIIPEDFVKVFAGFNSEAIKSKESKVSSAQNNPKTGGAGTITSGAPGALGKDKTVTPTPKRPESFATSLKDQLIARLNKDGEGEIKEAIHSILASLSHASVEQTTADAKPDSTETLPFPVARRTDLEKQDSEESVAEDTSNQIAKSMDAVRGIETEFVSLQQAFTFPSKLDFSPPSSRPSTPTSDALASRLAYTPRNHPVRYYEQSLSGLLAQLDCVESFGSIEVRMKRKEVVEKVEGALEELEKEVEGRWRSQNVMGGAEVRDAETQASNPQESAVFEPSSDETKVEHLETEPGNATAEDGVEAELVPEASSPVDDVPQADVGLSELREQSFEADVPTSSSESDGVDKSTNHDDLLEESGNAPSATPEKQNVDADSVETSEDFSPVTVSEDLAVDTPSSTTPPNFSVTSPPSLSASYPPTAPSGEGVLSVDGDVESASSGDENVEESDGFLLSEHVEDVNSRLPDIKEEDVDSDWSEVEA
ncbi:hypothetical protein VNI00_014327 [Paramarasmius palmivorus]|uniref:BAG domain-containing protein n=1 Tax=Paramarasmius palmivorus TaxID=297713 RepID=A0AAW0BTD2_9AGAR